MENRFYKDDFEGLVKSSADQYRMFPSENVWKGINNRLHTRRKWYGAGLAFLLLSIGTVTWVMFTNPPSHKQIADKNTFENTSKNNQGNTEKVNTKENSVFIAPKVVERNSEGVSHHTLSGIITNTMTVGENSVKPTNTTPPVGIEAPENNLVNTALVEETKTFSPKPSLDVKTTSTTVAATRPENEIEKVALINVVSTEKQEEAITEASTIVKNNTAEAVAAINTEVKTEEITDGLGDKNLASSINDKGSIGNVNPYTIESVGNQYVKLSKPKKATWQIYFTPTVTYRSLQENQAFIKAARNAANPIGPNNPSPATVTYSNADLEQVVSHKPDLGFQLGTAVSHRLSNRFNLVTGFQFNVNKYDVKAYGYTTEVATISLNTLGRNSSVSTVTSYRVLGSGYNVNWLRNFYFSASVPVGLEYIVARGKRAYFGVGANIQPTYILDNKSYLVSTDYKNYAQVPSLTRHWNVNTGAEIFAGIKNKRSEWRIAPQVRYQTLSSYKNTYPVNENLFDVGVKLGLILK